MGVTPSCSPKKSKCTKGVNVSIDTANGCTVTGKYKNTGKKQSMSGLAIDGFVTAAPTTTAIPTTAGPTAAPGETQGCQCLPDFLIYWLQAVPASHSADLPVPVCQTPPCFDKKKKKHQQSPLLS